jgi:hypothetical protein
MRQVVGDGKKIRIKTKRRAGVPLNLIPLF